MAKKIFESTKTGLSNRQLTIKTPEFGDTDVLIAIFEKGSALSFSYVCFDKSTAVSFINELKRQIAKLDNKSPF